MSWDEIASVVAALSDLLTVLRSADPADKAEIYTQHWQFESVRGGLEPLAYILSGSPEPWLSV
jgi:hypothetical protein